MLLMILFMQTGVELGCDPAATSLVRTGVDAFEMLMKGCMREVCPGRKGAPDVAEFRLRSILTFI
jgi:hypothetical protein